MVSAGVHGGDCDDWVAWVVVGMALKNVTVRERYQRIAPLFDGWYDKRFAELPRALQEIWTRSIERGERLTKVEVGRIFARHRAKTTVN